MPEMDRRNVVIGACGLIGFGVLESSTGTLRSFGRRLRKVPFLDDLFPDRPPKWNPPTGVPPVPDTIGLSIHRNAVHAAANNANRDGVKEFCRMTSGYKTMKQWQDGLKIMRGEQSLREYLQRERPYLELITPDPLKAIQSVNELAMLFSEVETFSILTPEQQLDYLESIRGNVCDLLD